MTTFLLIRHGMNDYVASHRIAGRIPGIKLNADGATQAEALVPLLAGYSIDRIYSSPLERTMETAAPLSRARSLKVKADRQLVEVDYGEWSGLSRQQLEADPRWATWNSSRGVAEIPGGERMLAVQQRICTFINERHSELPGKTLAVFSHADVIRAALLYYLGMPIDFYARLEISPGSLSVLRIGDGAVEVSGVNLRG